MEFQNLERRNAKDEIVSQGVVSKHSPLTSSKNDGIYDIIAQNLDFLKKRIDEWKSDISQEEIQKVLAAEQNIYKSLQIIHNSQSETTAESYRAQMAAKSAEESYDYIKKVIDSANSRISEMKDLINAMSNFTEAYRQLTGFDSLSNGNVGNSIIFHDLDRQPYASVRVDDKGEFHFTGKIHGDLYGMVERSTISDSAKKLYKPIKINGVEFDGSQDITVDAGLMDKKRIRVVLKEGLWDGSRCYKIEHYLITKDTDIIMMPVVGTSATVYSKISEACIICDKQEDGYIVLKCLGDPPAQDVTIELLML